MSFGMPSKFKRRHREWLTYLHQTDCSQNYKKYSTFRRHFVRNGDSKRKLSGNIFAFPISIICKQMEVNREIIVLIMRILFQQNAATKFESTMEKGPRGKEGLRQPMSRRSCLQPSVPSGNCKIR